MTQTRTFLTRTQELSFFPGGVRFHAPFLWFEMAVGLGLCSYYSYNLIHQR
jgi:hypothetical protein